MVKTWLLPILFFSLALHSCNTAPDKKEDAGVEAPKLVVSTAPVKPVGAPVSNLNAATTDNLVSVRDAYFGLKDALVATNAGKADAAASRLLSATDLARTAIRHDSLKEKALLLPQMDTIMKHCNAILALKDETCNRKREQFAAISDAAFTVFKNAGLRNAGIYQQHCPMALHNKGANWLAAEEEIRNPYFGDKMMDCGELTDSLK